MIAKSNQLLDSYQQNPQFSNYLTRLSKLPEASIAKLQTLQGDTLSSLLIFIDKSTKSIGIYAQSFDMAWSSVSPSYCAIVKLMEYAHDHGYKYVDFLRGEEEHKSHFVDWSIPLYKYVHIFNQKLNQQNVMAYIHSCQE